MTGVLYLVTRFFNRLVQFLRHWYVDSFMVLSHLAVNTFEFLDRSFALRVTLRHIFEPLYQDRTVAGHILGFIFRLARIILGLAVYAALLIVFVAAYVLWAVALIVLIYIVIKYHGIA